MTLHRATNDTEQIDDDADLSDAEIDHLYERYGRPLEPEHRGEFLAVSRDGETLLAPVLADALDQGIERFGHVITILKIGDHAVGSI